MEFDRDELLTHLRRIHCDGKVSQVAFQPDGSVNAMTRNRVLFLSSPPFHDGFSQEAIGLGNLKRLIDVVKKSTRSGDNVVLEVNDSHTRLIVRPDGDTRYQLVLSDPERVKTSVDERAVQAISDELGKNDDFILPQNVADQLLTAHKVLNKPEELKVRVMDDKTLLQFGDNTGDHGRFQVNVTHEDGPYKLSLRASYVVSVLERIDDFYQANMIFTGPESVVGFEYKGYTYAINAM